MTQSTKSISPLRQRMIDDMTLRKLSPKTQSAYIRSVKKLTQFLGRSPGTAQAEDLRRFQLHLVEQGEALVGRLRGRPRRPGRCGFLLRSSRTLLDFLLLN